MSSKKTVPLKKGSRDDDDDDGMNHESSLLERQPGERMNPVPILAGYGPRGERIRHTVHNGALKLPKDALDILDAALKDTGVVLPSTFTLPGLDAVVRPTLDPTMNTVIVTHIGLELVQVPDPSYQPPMNTMPPGYPEPPLPKMVDVVRTKIENQMIQRRTVEVAPVDRIRGGGGGGEGDDVMMDVDPSQADQAAPAPAPPGPTAVSTLVPPRPSTTPSAPASTAGDVPPQATTHDIVATTNSTIPTAPSSSTVPTTTIDRATEASLPLPVTEPSSQATTTTPSAPLVPGPPPVAPLIMQPPVAPTSQTPIPPPAQPPTAAAPVPILAPSAAAPAVAPVPSSIPTSSTTPVKNITSNTSAPPPTKLQILDSKPEPRWEQHRPGPNDEMVAADDQLTTRPFWYTKEGVAEIEQTMLPEWFNHSAKHRTPESYIKARETILEMSATMANRNVTNAMVRRSVVGDAGSLMRLRNFLTHFGLINEDATNDSAPTPSSLRDKYPVPKQFNDRQRDHLVMAVVEQSRKRRKLGVSDNHNNNNSFVPINWEEVAQQVGDGATPDDCERNFLSIPIQPEQAAERPITPETSSMPSPSAPLATNQHAMRHRIIQELVENCPPEVVRKATAAALEAAPELEHAQSGALLGLVSSKAVETATQAENQVESVLSQLLDQRMKKLENRMAMMDDVEAILEAEKMALELERRDLYTARCRHWFGGA